MGFVKSLTQTWRDTITFLCIFNPKKQKLTHFFAISGLYLRFTRPAPLQTALRKRIISGALPHLLMEPPNRDNAMPAQNQSRLFCRK